MGTGSTDQGQLAQKYSEGGQIPVSGSPRPGFTQYPLSKLGVFLVSLINAANVPCGGYVGRRLGAHSLEPAACLDHRSPRH